MIRPLIRKAGKVPKEAGLDARVGAAGDENGGAGEVSTTTHKDVHNREYCYQLDLGDLGSF